MFHATDKKNKTRLSKHPDSDYKIASTQDTVSWWNEGNAIFSVTIRYGLDCWS